MNNNEGIKKAGDNNVKEWKQAMRRAMFSKRMREITAHYRKSNYLTSPSALFKMIMKKTRKSLKKDKRYNAYC